MNALFVSALWLCVMVIAQVVDSSPWVFEEIKPVKEFTVKKSSLPDAPVKEIDPLNNHINIKQDIREDIVGSNGTTAKYKEGVKKLLDFLEAGSIDDGKQSDTPSQAPTPSRTNTSQEDQHKETPTTPVDSIESSVAKILLQMGKLTSNKSASHDITVADDKASFSGNPRPSNDKINVLFPSQKKATTNSPDPRPAANPTNTQTLSITSNNLAPMAPEHTSSLTAPQQIASVPMTSQQSASAAMTSQHITSPIMTSQQGSVYTKSGIPYVSNSLPSSVYGQQPIAKKSSIPYSMMAGNTPYRPYQPYIASSYQRLPYSWYNNKRYNIPLHIIPVHYPAYQPAAAKPNIVRSKLPLPLYRNPYTAYHPAYARNFVPNHLADIYRSPLMHKPAMSTTPRMRLSTIPHAPVFQRSQIPHGLSYRHEMPWNAVPRPLGYPTNTHALKYRRMAINDRGKAYSGLKSPHERVAQKTPLPLPLASIMTAARIVVPARPYTLNGALKSNVETPKSEDAEEKSARAV